ncbi:hypothetical protein D4Q80_00995, partial [bacterium]
KLEENIIKQGRLSGIFTEGLLAIEAYKKQIIPLRDEEKEIKGKIRKLELSLIERERNDEYLRMIKDVVNHFQSINERMDLVSKKGLLRMLFRSIKIDNGGIKSFELFEPYKSLYEGARIKWEVQENQILTTERASVSTLLPSDDEWVESYRTTLLFLKGLFQYEASRSTRITQTEGSSTTLLESKDS